MHFSNEEKALWLEDWRQSGKSAWAYARENGLVPQTFIRWTKGGPEAKPVFVEIPIQDLPLPRGLSEILIEKGDIKIHIPLALGCTELRAVMEGLGNCL